MMVVVAHAARAVIAAAFSLVAVALAPALAHAYSTPAAYADRPSSGGGGGRWFTGSPAEGYACSVCHSPTPGQRQYPLYVTGLPLQGYALGNTQEVVLSWPEFAEAWRGIRPDPMMVTADQQTPAVGLVAELVAESGKGSGTIEIDEANATAGELCEQTRPNLKPRLGVNLYQVRPGLDPLRIKPDSTGILRCEARQLGQRCVVALNSCGAHEVRIRWTTPGTWEGPIWFSAGFVATESISGSFDADSVDEITVPLLQGNSDASKYERIVRSGCALTGVPGDGGGRDGSRGAPAPGWMLVGAAALLLSARGASRRRTRRGRRSPWA